MLWLIAPAINLKTGDKKNYSSSFYCSFYWATLIFGYLAYSSSTTYAANEDNKEENTFGGYPCLFVWNCRLYWAADCLHARTIYSLAKSRFQFAYVCNVSLFQALGQWGQSKKRAGNKQDQLRVGSGSGKERAGEPVSIVFKTSFRPLEKRNRFLWQNIKCQKSPYVLFLYQTPLVARPLFQSSTLTESLEQARWVVPNRVFTWR